MSQPADRNLLFGILALQMDFIKREQLIAAEQAWVADKSQTLGQILVSQKAIAQDSHALLEALVAKHVALHDNDAGKSLSAFNTVPPVRAGLEQIADKDLQESLTHVSMAPAHADDLYATIGPDGRSPIGPGKYATLDTVIGAQSNSRVRYRIVRPHAKGGLGEVFVALDQELHREVALKEIQDRQADNAESRSRFVIEAEITGGLEHPGIVPVYGLGTYPDGRPYYAMRFIRGDSLKDAIDHFHKADQAGMDPGQRTLELRGLLGRFVDVCNAMAYAHSRSVLHRDLKPGNIMLGKYGETLVVDWGLAKPIGETPDKTSQPEASEHSLIPHSSIGSQTMMGSAVGTPQYMSPEQAGGRHNQLGPASDVYSLGATLYCLLTGQPPFMDRDVGTVLHKVQSGVFPKPRDVKASVPMPLDAICRKAMALKPEDRYATAAGLADDIEHWLADEPVSAWTEPLWVRARRWISRHATLVTGVASAVAIGFVSLIVATVLLKAANDREREAKGKAEANFALARGAVDKYLTNVSDEVLLQEPGMQPLRMRLLESAKEFNERFRAERAGDPSVQAELAKATYRLAQITGEIGSELDAIKLHEEAVQLFEALPPGKVSSGTQADLAACYHHLGRLNRLADKMAKSEQFYKKALGIWEQLVNDQPKESRFRDGLARTQLGLGNVYQVMRRRQAAQDSYESAMANWDALRHADPNTPSYRRDLATARNNLGLLLKYIPGKQEDAKKSLDEAKALQLKLVEDAPNVGQYQIDLARTYLNLGQFQEALKLWNGLIARNPAVTDPHKSLAEAYLAVVPFELQSAPKKAEEDSQTALAVLRKLAAAHPGMSSYQGDLARGWTVVSEVYRSANQLDQAEQALSEAIKIQKSLVHDITDVPHYGRDLARSYYNLGLVFATGQREDKAEEAFKQSLRFWEKLVTDYGRDVDYLAGVAATCEQLGDLASATSNAKEAIIWYRRALEVAPEARKQTIQKRIDALRST